ncbi:hypothetical protein AB1Y20_018715 [Prymnesium parvum]|uniref:Apple domain-containing protein n=1 Tax=Prymnesium parvum TaxID=97485 RepID=A0AB34JS87_PRYPA|mmetsp:Transcript_23635/g.54096  ORF Transcript_23635/g.54096 Transcript_23635/m.54096 type:complete len:226 (-) Transcript_23635:97-774(-)
MPWDDSLEDERQPLFTSRSTVIAVRARGAALAVGVLFGFAIGYELRLSYHERRSAVTTGTTGWPPVITYQPRTVSVAEEEEAEKEDDSWRNEPSGTLLHQREEAEQRARNERDRRLYPNMTVPSYRFVGEGHLPFDALNAPQPGNITPGECARVCSRHKGCFGFAWFSKPSWSAVSECYLKRAQGACTSKLFPAGPSIAFTWASDVLCRQYFSTQSDTSTSRRET